MEDIIRAATERMIKTGEKKGPENPLDSELKEILKQKLANIKVVGIGGGGNNTISRLMDIGVKGVQTIAVNTDAQDLLFTTADVKILIGRDTSGGLGAGSDPEIGKKAAEENVQDIRNVLKGTDMVFVCAGMGGGTGTGAAPIVAREAKKIGALTVAVCTTPFVMEGEQRNENARQGIEELRKVTDTLILIPNDKLLELVPDVPLETAFKIADEILVNAVKGIAELVTKPGLVNIDFADVKAVMRNGGVAMIGVGQSSADKKATEAIEKAIQNPLLDVDITGSTGALVCIYGGEDLTLSDAESIVEVISEKVDKSAKVIWGAHVLKEMKGVVKVMIIITGVHSSQILGAAENLKQKYTKKIEKELGIDFIAKKSSSSSSKKDFNSEENEEQEEY